MHHAVVVIVDVQRTDGVTFFEPLEAKYADGRSAAWVLWDSPRVMLRHRRLGHLYVLDSRCAAGRLVLANEVLETATGTEAPKRLEFTARQRKSIRAGMRALCAVLARRPPG